ncbi:anaerobic dehydrogenase, typically selenocysteine-containing [Desulfocurvibacter africanus PCS]|uniref:Anaerobic dehydrogenase, typically selenocysteine-containing n=1 Tax=Desulfocurvibacter africanus PCS TaxID=1262666 RepID=M5PPH5_DESAF|nr:molybdopterin-dependent oxidoreductase [Desulfocurvibacter africanus]EMG35845.1 anaerobic dehydrogenase, typically selenocysteine-containing [Desulfocurvibacter africanus PCS]
MTPNKARRISRRGFLKAAGAVAAGLAAARPETVAAVAGTPAAAITEWESRFSACDMCMNRCGLIARVENGVVRKLDPNPKFLKSRGMLCARGNAGIDQLYDPDRLKHPLLRVGERGEGKWKRIPWDEALDMAAQRLQAIRKEYSPSGVMFMAGSDFQSQFVNRFAEVFGSFNVTSHESNCLMSNTRAYLDTFGEVPFADVLNSKYVLMAGANRFEALITPDSMDLMTAMRERGCKLVVLDPRFTKTAALAHEWWPIKPGTDMAFMLAVMHVITSENLYDKTWIAEKTYGIEQLTQHVKRYDPRWAENECGIPAADIARMAREMAAAAPRAMVYPGRRTSDYVNSTQIRRSFAMLNALLANWDRPGGLLGAREVGLGSGIPFSAPWYDENPFERADAGIAPLMIEHEGSYVLLREAVLSGEPYPLKGFFAFKVNPLATAPDRAKSIEMMKAFDFSVVVDIAMSDTAWFADLVLPAPSYLERMDPASALQGSSACACVVDRDPVVPAMFESRPVFDICKALAQRLELGEFFDFDMAAFRKAQLKDLPGAEKALAEDGVYYNPSKVYGIYEGRIYKTKSQKIEFFNQRYADEGLDPMPVYSAPKAVPEGMFRMVVGRSAVYTHSTTNNALLRQLEPDCLLWIHPKRAEALGIRDGDAVIVQSSAGQGPAKALVTEAIRPDTTYMPTGFGALSKGLSLAQGNGASMAGVLESNFDAITGNAAMHETFVTVTRKA